MPRKKGTPHTIDRTGQIFGLWTVLERMPKTSNWLCRCGCGTEKVVSGSSLVIGTSKSCGCAQYVIHTKHGMEGTATYNSWAAMLARCNNVRHKQYLDYGGRGIAVCSQWHKFENFYADMGEKPSDRSLDRIDNNAGYSKDNCRWATQLTQIRNRRVSPIYEFEGSKKSLAEWAEIYRIPWRRLYERMRKGWKINEALLIPIGDIKSRKRSK